MQKDFAVDIRWRGFPLHTETPADGQLLEDLFAGSGIDVARMMARLRQVAGELGLPFGDRTRTYNSRLAQELGSWAESANRGAAFHAEAFRAYFVAGRNLAQTPVLLEVATAAGLPAEAAREVIAQRTFKAAVDADWRRAQDLGVTAVPTFYINHDRLVGAQPYAELARLLATNGVPPAGTPVQHP